MAARTVGECCLRWTDHDSLLQGVCNNLLSTEKFADVTLFCEGVSLKCHKFILSACSSYFDQILSESLCEHPVIILKDVLYWQMQALLHFIYKGELTTDETELTSLVELAQSLHIKGIGEFGTADEVNRGVVPKQKQKQKLSRSTTPPHEKPNKNMKEYLTVGNNINTSLSNRLLNIAQDSQPLLNDPLSAPIDTSDFNLQETVEYSFESESLGDSQHMSQPILIEYPQETNVKPETNVSQSLRDKRRNADSEAEVSSDVSASNLTTTHVYKRYSEENLCAAIKAVVEDGARQFDACNKYGIPFTTLTRKLRLYKACGGRLPHVISKRKERRSSRSNVTLATVLSMDNDLDGSTSNENPLEPDGVVLVIENPMEVISAEEEPKMPSFKQYKTYSEDNLNEAITAVLHNGMRLQEASNQYKIPLSTLSRKIRSSKPIV